MEVKSESGSGTTFTVRIPRVGVSEEGLEAPLRVESRNAPEDLDQP